MSFAASSMEYSEAVSGLMDLWCSGRSLSSTGIIPILTGKSIKVAPGFSRSAYLKARRVISAIVSGRTTV